MNEQEIGEAMIEWERLSANKENRAIYEARLKFLRDQLSNIRGERRAGREEGVKEGMSQIVRNMARNGLEIEEIAKLTGLGVEKVREMLRDNE